MRNRRWAAAAALLIGGIVPVPGVATAAPQPAMPYDFNGDGYADLTVGAPYEDVGARRDAGIVQVLYGSAAGVTAHDQIWHQGRKGVKGAVEREDRFGTSHASGDFDADGYADLAIGIPGEDLAGYVDTGAVQVLYGSPTGLTGRDQIWHQDRKGVIGHNEDGDRFGWALAAGDFTGDGRDDLAIGVLGEGRVAILRGSDAGLTAAVDQNLSGTGGRQLEAGDINGDGVSDLAITQMWDQPVAVHVFLGGPNGLAASQAIERSALNPSDFDELQVSATALADFNGDGRADLAIGLERDELDRPLGEAVSVLYARADGFRADQAQVWSLDDPILPGSSSQGDSFGAAIAAGDLTGDGLVDLAVGVPNRPTAGGALLLAGSPTGLTATPLLLTRELAGLAGANDSTADQFGSALAVLPLGGTTALLAVGASGDGPGTTPHAGSVTTFPGSPAGPVTAGAQLWHQDSPGIRGAAEPDDLWGVTLG